MSGEGLQLLTPASFKSYFQDQGYRDSVNQTLQRSSLISKPLLENEKQFLKDVSLQKLICGMKPKINPRN